MEPDKALEVICDVLFDEEFGGFQGAATAIHEALLRAGVFDAITYCPRCGTICDELTDEVLDDYERPPRPGKPFVCGWCKTEQTDWNHLERCRKLGENALEIRFADAGRRLQYLLDGLAG